mmetsp:Transcript_2914/g.5391  ORF Transcript_2914/g.5391 Transcript_2914/m.5391 type:complete len:96 (+) Transcript_2914:163-450(+)
MTDQDYYCHPLTDANDPVRILTNSSTDTHNVPKSRGLTDAQICDVQCGCINLLQDFRTNRRSEYQQILHINYLKLLIQPDIPYVLKMQTDSNVDL